MNNINILYVDDDAREFEPLARSIMKMVGLDEFPPKLGSEGSVEYQLIKGNSKYTIFCVEDKESALYYINKRVFDIVFIDYQLRNEIVGTEVGLKISEAVHNNPDYSGIYLIMLTAYNERIIDTLRSGLFKDFLNKDQLNNLSDVQGTFTRFEAFRESERKRIEAEKRADAAEKREKQKDSIISELQKDFNVDMSAYSDESSLLKGNSEALKQIRWFISLYAQVSLPVLVLGETGTGKELVAKELHKQGKRKNNVFHVINCGAIPETLIESVLFGYKKGSHSEAKGDKKGAFEIADKGTLFLDEFGDLSPLAQVKVLRAIETGEILPIGSDLPIKVDVRVVCATSLKLKENAGAENFRIDLFYRVGGLFPEVPSLRDRRSDIFDILYFKFQDFNPGPFTPDAINALVNCEYDWPGNVRELLNFLDHTLAIFPKSRFDKSKTLKLLELWKTHQPVIDLVNSFSDKTGNNKKISSIENNPDSDSFSVQPYEVKDLIQFLKTFIKKYEEFEAANEIAPTLSEIEKMLEPSNRHGWLSQRFSKTEIDSKKIIYAIKNNRDLNRLKSIAPFKKFFN